jgi:hypothetical protein
VVLVTLPRRDVSDGEEEEVEVDDVEGSVLLSSGAGADAGKKYVGVCCTCPHEVLDVDNDADAYV